MSTKSFSVSQTPPPSHDQIAYGLGLLASLGLGSGQVYQLWTQGTNRQGLSGVAAATIGCFLSTMGIIRSNQLPVERLKDSESKTATLPEGTVDEVASLKKIQEKVKKVSDSLGLLNMSTITVPTEDNENFEQEILNGLDSILEKCLSEKRSAEKVLQELADLKKKELSLQNRITQPSETPQETQIRRLQRDLNDAKEDLESAYEQIENLEAIIEENKKASALFEGYIEQLEKQLKKGQESPEKVALTGILSNMRKTNETTSSLNNSPRPVTPKKLAQTPNKSSVRFANVTKEPPAYRG